MNVLTGEGVERRLVAVLAADVAGYSRLMGLDEEGTLARLKAVRKTLVDPTIAAHRGRIVKTTGDGLLVEFASAVDAARCAAEVQTAMKVGSLDIATDARIEFRIGIHVGDIIIDDNDIFGDGVNIAARLEGIAELGGICVSDDAWRQIRGKVDIAFDDIGPQALKNIVEPMRAWRARLGGAGSPVTPITPPTELAKPLALPDKPSIAVLPFQNMSGDPEQEYFADGMVEDIITALSRFKSLFVIARNSSFTYKGKAVDIKQVGRELGVRYVLEGSVRRAGDKVRITGQLIDSETGTHLWADRFEGSIEDVFYLQDRVTARVVGAIAPKIESAEIERARRKPTANLDAYDCWLRGLAYLNQLTKESNTAALQLFCRAIEIDPHFASAYGMAARCYTLRAANSWMTDFKVETEETKSLSRKAAELGQDDAVALCFGGFALARVGGELDGGLAYIERAITLNPNLAHAWNFSGFVKALLGDSEMAIEHIAKAIRFNPLDPSLYSMQAGTALAHFLAGRYEDALEWSEKTLREKPTFLPALRMRAISHALAGRLELAKDAMARACEIDPTSRISTLSERLPLRHPEDRAKWEDGLRKAGLAE